MLLLFDIGNTNTHLGIANSKRVIAQRNIPTNSWFKGGAEEMIQDFVSQRRITGTALCSVVPKATPRAIRTATRLGGKRCFVLNHQSISGVGINYPQPQSIGPDRLANSLAASHHFGSPVVVVGFGTAVAFDVVDQHRNYIGGIIAPGLAAMTEYLHEKTALLPEIKIREVKAVVGKSTEEAMLIGAVHGYRGLIRELIAELKAELRSPALPVIATGGYASLIAAKLPEITSVVPLLTLEGLRLSWEGANISP